MFQVKLTNYGQTLISSQVIFDGIILLYDYIEEISSLSDISSYTVNLDEEACGNLNKNVGNVRIRDLSISEYQSKTILFYINDNNEKKIVAGYSQTTPIVQKNGQPLTLFLSLDFSVFTNGFLFSSIQAGMPNASHNNDGIVHIENPEISSDDTYSVYSKPQVDELLKNKDTELIRGTQSVSTASWTGNTIRDSLYEGMCINYFLPFAGKASSTLTLTLSNGNETDAIPIYFRGATAVGTHFPVGSVIQLTYMENVVIGSTTIAKGWFADSDYVDGNTTSYISTAQPLKAGTNGIYGRCLVMRTGVDTWESIMLSYSTNVASHVLNTNGFYPDVIFYTSGTTKVNSGSSTTATHYNIYNTLSYTNYFADVTTTPLVIGKPFYFVGTFHNDGKFYFNNPNYHAQEVTTDDIYVLVGIAYSATTISLLPEHPMYTLKNGVVTQITHQSFINSAKIDDLEDSIPTNTSDLTNDSGFITSSDIPTNVSSFTNDAGYLTSYTETDPTVPSWAKQPNKPSYTASEVHALPDTTVIPTVNDTTITIKKNNSDIGDSFTTNTDTEKTINLGLATVATSGSYNDLLNKPTIPTVNDTTITIKKNTSDTGDSFTTNTDTEKTINLGLHSVATSGSYNDLSNKPTIPTKTSDLTNDSGFITSSDIPEDVSAFNNDAGYLTSFTETDPTVPSWAKQSTKPSYTLDEVTDGSTRKLPTKTSQLTNDSNFLTSHQSIKTINNQSLIGTGNVTIATGENNVIESISVNNIAQTVTNKNVNITVPTKTSDLTNDSGFITSASIPSDISAFNNDAGYITTEADPTVPNWAKQANKPSYNLDEVTDGSTRKLSNYVPTSRKVNNKALSSDITLNLDDVLDGSTRKLNNYIPYSEVISTINGFDNRRLWQYEIHNTLWAANKRYDVTLTGFSNNNASASLFDGSFETNVVVPKNGTGVILISGKNNTKMWSGGYPYGYLEVAFYYTNVPESVTCRVYSDWAQNPGWHSITLTNVCKNSNQALYRGVNTGFYGVTQMEITINAKDSVTANVTEVAFYQTRGTLQQMSVFNKTVAQTLYHDLTAPRFRTTDGTSSQFVKGDGSLDSSTYITSASLPTKVSQLTNDAGYITSSALTPYELKTNLKEGAYIDVDETTMTSTSTNLPTGKAIASYISGLNYATVSQVPTNVSQLNNDSGYLTDEDLPDFELKSNLKDGAYKDVNTSITSSTKTSTNLATVNAITSYIEPLIPTKTSEITNDSGFITSASIPTNVSAFNNDAGYLTSHQSLAGVVASAQYNATTKKIEFYNSSSTKLNTDIDASAFIKDGMIDTVEISNDKLVISFNTDAGKEDIEIPISDIFDASNYYTKTETNTQISSAITNLNLGTASTKNYSTDMNTDANLPTTSAIKSYISDQGFALASSVPTKTSELTNDSNFITSSSLDDYVLKVSSTDNAIVRFNGTSGEVQNSNVIIDDSNNLILPIATSATFANNAKLVLGNAWFGSNPSGGLAYGTRSGSTYAGKYTFEATTFRPVSGLDNSIDIGTSSYRWKDLYIAGKICKSSSYQITVPSNSGTMALTSDIPTNISALNNDSGFITSSELPTNVSELNNDSGYITSAALTPYELKTNLKEGAYVDVDETTMTSSSTNLPTSKAVASYISSQGFATVSQIPDSTSDLTNNSGFITSADIPTNVSSFINDAGYLVSSDLPTNHATTDTAQEITGAKTIAENKLKIGSTSSSEDIDNFVFKRGQEFIVGTQTSSTSLWKGNTIQDSIYEGMCVNYFVPVACTSTAITLELTLPDGTTTGAIPVRRNAGSTATSTHIGIGSVVQLTLLLNRTVGSTSYEKVWRMNEWYDSNSNTVGYQLRTNSTVMNVSDTARYYKLYFTSANGNLWVPASVNSTNDATTARAVNQRPINPFGRIVYTSASTNYATGANLAAATIWDQYNLSLGYSFNVNGGTLALTAEKPVYVKCAPQADGSAIIDSTTPTVQDLPTSNDGKIYIFLGTATSATAVELFQNHPVYYHDGNGIKLWSGVVLPSKTSDLTNDSGFITSSDVPTNVSAFNNDAGYLTSYTETDPTVPSWAKTTNKPSYNLDEVADGSTRKLSNYVPTSRKVNSKALSSDITLNLDDVADGTNRKIPTNTNQLTNGAGFITSSDLPTNHVTTDTAQTITGNKTFSGTLTGTLTGNADTATTATNADNVGLLGNSSASYICPIVFAGSVNSSTTDRANKTLYTPTAIDETGNGASYVPSTSTFICKNQKFNRIDYVTNKNGMETVTFITEDADSTAYPAICTRFRSNNSTNGQAQFIVSPFSLKMQVLNKIASNDDIAGTWFNVKRTILDVNIDHSSTNSSFSFGCKVLPLSDGSFSLGSSNNRWNALYAQYIGDGSSYVTSAFITTINGTTFTGNANTATTATNAINATNATNLSYTANSTTTAKLTATDTQVTAKDDIIPDTYNAYDLGSSSKYWKNIYAYSFIKKNGTSSQFLKADGSVDSSSYITSSDIPLTSISVDGTTQTITNKNVDLHIPDDIYSSDFICSMTRTNVSGSGNLTLSGISGPFPVSGTPMPAGTYIVRTRMQSTTASYSLTVNFGGSYTLTTTNGVIDDTRTITLSSASTYSASITQVNSNTFIKVSMFEPDVIVETVGAAAVTNDYNDLDNTPTIGNGTLTIQKNGSNVATFNANNVSNVTANITVPTNTNQLTNGAGFITSSDLPTNHVTTDTVQTISGNKTFTGTLTGTLTGNADTATTAILASESFMLSTINAYLSTPVRKEVVGVQATSSVIYNLIPAIKLSENNVTTNLGSSSYKWDRLYCNYIGDDSNKVILYGHATQAKYLSSDSSNSLANAALGATSTTQAWSKNLVPYSGNTYNLGGSAAKWNNVYANFYNGFPIIPMGEASWNSTNSYWRVTLSPAPTSITAGMIICVRFDDTNTHSSPKLNVNGLGSGYIYRTNTSFAGTTVAESWPANCYILLRAASDSNSSNWVLVSTNSYPTSTASGTTNIIPSVNSSGSSTGYDLGSTSYKWRYLYAYGVNDGVSFSNRIGSNTYTTLFGLMYSLRNSGRGSFYLLYINYTNSATSEQKLTRGQTLTANSNLTLNSVYESRFYLSGTNDLRTINNDTTSLSSGSFYLLTPISIAASTTANTIALALRYS